MLTLLQDLTTQLMNATEELRALRQDSTKAKMLQMTGKISRSFSSMKRDSLSSLSSHGMSLFRNSSHGDLQENSHVKDTDEGVQKQSD